MLTEDELQLLLHLVSIFTMRISKRMLKRSFKGRDTRRLQGLLATAKSLDRKLRALEPGP